MVKGLDDIWYGCNDLKITEIGRTLSKEDTENAYMLFYQKMITGDNSSPTSSSIGSSEKFAFEKISSASMN